MSEMADTCTYLPCVTEYSSKYCMTYVVCMYMYMYIVVCVS